MCADDCINDACCTIVYIEIWDLEAVGRWFIK